MKKILPLLLLIFIYVQPISAQEEKLEIDGAIQISDSEDPTPDPGTIRWTGSDFEGFNGTAWVSFSTQGSSPVTIRDVDGNEYLTVQIGDQLWMKENLRTSRYREGTPIALVIDNTLWSTQDSSGKFRWYNDDWTLDGSYGKMYNWYAVDDSRGLCPSGWHVPTDAEWTELVDHLGGSSTAGGKMKIYRTVIWDSPNAGATNESGFTALPGGYLFENGTFNYFRQFGGWWSSTEDVNDQAWNRANSYAHAILSRNSSDKRRGYSVRCVQD